MKKYLIIFLIVVSFPAIAAASIIEELELPPEGAHGGQMLLGFSFTIGYPFGSGIDAETAFVEGSTYTFTDSSITKKFYIDHIAYSFGLMFEYMPIDYVGACVRFRRGVIMQRTSFGSDYNNTSKVLFNDYSFIIGPSFHLTTRKWWDVSFTPMVGYSYGEFKATPVATSLLTGYSGSEKVAAMGLVVAIELRFTAFFNGGFFLSAGFEWSMNMPALDGEYSLVNPQTGVQYSLETNFTLHSVNFILVAGYAFAN